MNPYKRPLSVTIVACVYLAVGAIGFVVHFRELAARHQDAVGIEITELTAVLCGVFLLRGHNWARWLALAWIAFHVILSAFHEIPELVTHSVIGAVITWMLFHPEAARYFRAARVERT
jgi:Trk-type K+ transport system membrane component